MKSNQEMLERIIAVGVVILGVLLNQWILAGLGIAYFISKI